MIVSREPLILINMITYTLQEKIQHYNTMLESGQLDSILKNRISLLDWNSSRELDLQISEFFNMPLSYVRRYRLQNYRLPSNVIYKQERFLIENAHNYTFPNNFFGPYKMECIICDTVQEYGSKGALLRVLGHDKYTETKRNAGLCGTCAISTKRDWSHVTQEYRDKCTLRGFNRVYETSFNTLGKFFIWYKDNVDNTEKKKYKHYRKQVAKRSIKNLKLHNPQEYERWSNYKWDGTDMNQLTIDHDKEIWECYRDNWTVAQSSHISNLVVMSMRENLEKHRSKSLNDSDPKLLESQKEEIPPHPNFW